jgi:hypothetical protein
MSELSRLWLKAIRSLPPEEQDIVLESLVETRLAPWPESGAGPLPPELLQGTTLVGQLGHQYRRVELGPQVSPPPLGPETGGPWQSVPVRLSTEQHERLKQWCQANSFSMAVVLRGLVARFLDDQATRRPRPPATSDPPQPPPEEGAEPSVG